MFFVRAGRKGNISFKSKCMLTIIPTIDTEGVHGQQPFQQMVLGELDGLSKGWGVFRLANLFSKHRVNATFFVDVYEYSLWGKELVKEVCTRLTDLGFDVQLHTHPAWRDDPHDFAWIREHKKQASFLPQKKDFMTKLNVDEQVKVLSLGIELLTEWTGNRPVAHRSGGYSINAETIEALRIVDIPLDSSMHWGHVNSQLSWSRNQVVNQDGVIELPVTLIDYVFALPGIGPIYRKSMKTDVDTCSLQELLAYVNQALKKGVTVMNLFMHSYSLLKFDREYRHFRPEPSDVKKLDAFFSAVARMNNVRVMSCAELLERYQQAPGEFVGTDHVPEVQVNSKIVNLAIGKIFNRVHDALRYRVWHGE